MSEHDDTDVLVESRELDDIWTREHSASTMTTAEFASWLQDNLGRDDVQNAIKQAAFMLCCDVIAQDVSKATLRLRERLENGTSRVVKPEQHPVAGLLALEPNRRHTWGLFNQMLLYWGCLVSNAYAGVFRNNVGDPLELIPFQSGRITEYIEGRDVFYEVIAGTMQEQALLGMPSKRFPERDMIHIRYRMLDGMDGYSTLVAGSDVLDTGDAIDEYRKKLFSEEGQLRGVFTKKQPGPLDDKAFQRLREQLREMMTRFKRGTMPIVLEDGLEFQPISSKPMEMEITKQFNEKVVETCRLLRVPPHKIFQMDGSKYENLETMEKAYVGDVLIPRAKPMEEQFGRVLLTKKERLKYYFEFDREEMTLRDSQRQTERIQMLLERGAITIDEARAEFGYTELAGGMGKHRTIPGNMMVVDEHGKILIEPTPKPVAAGPGGGSNAPKKPAAKPKKDYDPGVPLELDPVGFLGLKN